MTNQSSRKVAIVTGASSGIGEALAIAMAAQGTHVVLVARSVDRLTALAARIEGAGGKATVLPVDLAAPAAAQRVFEEAQQRDLAHRLAAARARARRRAACSRGSRGRGARAARCGSARCRAGR